MATLTTDAPSLKHPLPYNPVDFPRELARHYLPASQEDIDAMLRTLGMSQLGDVFSHISPEVRFTEAPDLPEEAEYDALARKLEQLSEKNVVREGALGDGLSVFKVPGIIHEIAGIRGLTTSYTPYQPERSQGTLLAHWIYQCVMAKITGFEAINASLYDRSTALVEAGFVALRLLKKSDTILVPEALYPGDLEVARTLFADTPYQFETLPLDARTGRIDFAALKTRMEELGDRLAAIAFPQVNTLGLLEDVDALTNLAADFGVKSIGVIDPALLGHGGLKAPVDFGVKGCDMIVGEAQHLALPPSFGGPGLGLFGIRFNDQSKTAIRSTPGRYVGKGKDIEGRDCRVMVLSTREQHIRKDKATSNICSNQAFLATLAGAALLTKGEAGLAAMAETASRQALEAASYLTSLPGVTLACPESPFFHEITVELPVEVGPTIEAAREKGFLLGVDVSKRLDNGSRNLLKLSFTDRASPISEIVSFLNGYLAERAPGASATPTQIQQVPSHLRRKKEVGLPRVDDQVLVDYYRKLGELNMSPDEAPYPLGSCTMKYNPYLNDWAAFLPGFADIHPQAPIEDAQGALEVLYEIQVWFEKITGLAGATTQPVAGAQGELVGLKLFQAYHRDRREAHRDIVFIPKSAHGTNFATAIMAGYGSKNGSPDAGIVLLEADDSGKIDARQFEEKLSQYRDRLAGVMITNPNTTGLFETEFADVARKVHDAGGLVYMDGANMNAIAGWVDLGKLGVDAVHQNLHKTWSIPHGGGGPGDCVVAVSERLVDFLPGVQIVKEGERFTPVRPSKSIGSFHRHWGNFGHKVRAYAYLLRLGREGVRRMSAMAVLSARYLYERLRKVTPVLPSGTEQHPRMHEFILTLSEDDFAKIEQASGLSKAAAIPAIGKLFLDFGYHAPTVAWPEPLGLMIEPTESYTKAELDRFADTVEAILELVREKPAILKNAPYTTPVRRVDEPTANRNLVLHEPLTNLPELPELPVSLEQLRNESLDTIRQRLIDEAGV